MNSFFTPVSWNDAPFILVGVLNTIKISMVAIIAGTILGLMVGFIRSISNRPVNLVMGAFLDILRTVPLIIQLILFSTYVGVIGMPLDPFVSGSIILSLYTMAFMSEVFRAGFESVPDSMRITSRSLGMGYWQTLWYIVLPIGMRTVFPSWVGVSLSVIKDSALVSVIGYMELLRTSEQLITRSQQPLQILIGVGLFYFIISYPVSVFGKRIERKMAI